MPCNSNPGASGSSLPIATNSLSSQSEESEADNVCAEGENLKKLILGFQLCPTWVQRSHFFEQLTWQV